DGGRCGLRDQPRAVDAAAGQRVADGGHAALAEGGRGGGRRPCLRRERGQQGVQRRRRLALGEASRELAQRLLLERRLAVVLRALLEALAKRLDLELFGIGNGEDRTQAQPNRGLVAEEFRQSVEVLRHFRSRCGRAGQERDGIHRQRLDARIRGEKQLADGRKGQANRLEGEAPERAPDRVAEVELGRRQAAV